MLITHHFSVDHCSGQKSGETEDSSVAVGAAPDSSVDPAGSLDSPAPARSESHLKVLLRDELLINVQKFTTQVVIGWIVPLIHSLLIHARTFILA